MFHLPTDAAPQFLNKLTFHCLMLTLAWSFKRLAIKSIWPFCLPDGSRWTRHSPSLFCPFLCRAPHRNGYPFTSPFFFSVDTLVLVLWAEKRPCELAFFVGISQVLCKFQIITVIKLTYPYAPPGYRRVALSLELYQCDLRYWQQPNSSLYFLKPDLDHNKKYHLSRKKHWMRMSWKAF